MAFPQPLPLSRWRRRHNRLRLQPGDGPAQVPAQVGERALQNGAASNEDISTFWPGTPRQILLRKRTQAPLGPVPVNGAFAEFAAGGEPDAVYVRACTIKRDHLKDKSRRSGALPLFCRTHEVAATGQRQQRDIT